MSETRVTGLNHVTLAVADLERAVSFYQDTLGFGLRAIWDDGAYLDAGALWLCLSLDPNAKHARRDDYTHLALDVAAPHFPLLRHRSAQKHLSGRKIAQRARRSIS